MFEIVIRGIPLWLFQEYIEEIGGSAQADGWLHGGGWRARLTQVDDFELGSLRVGQVRLEIAGDAESVARARASLEPKLMRAGG